jgi:hypothetical protein
MAILKDQQHVLWRKDDGTLSTATNAAALDSVLSGSLDTNYRLLIASAGIGIGTSSFTPKIQYNKNNAGWNDVNGASSVARSSLSSNVTDNANTSQNISTGTFTAGQFDETDGTVSNSVTFSDISSTCSEHEFCMQIRSADVTTGDQILFRLVTSTSSTYDTYTNYGTFDVGTGIANKGDFFSLWD